MKEIQRKYKSDPQLQQQKMAQLYQDNNVNPLAGCLPALVQIPVFISLYRALTNLAAQVRVCFVLFCFVCKASTLRWIDGNEHAPIDRSSAPPRSISHVTSTSHAPSAWQNELDEPFLWLPNLEGPTYGAGPTDGMNWLTKGWEGLQPSLGWHDTIAFLTIPLILIVSQSISQKILQPPGAKDDPVRAEQSG